MISFKELLSGHPISDVSIAIQHNLEDLLTKMNQVRFAWGKLMFITSGYRSMQDHLRIYSQLAYKRGVDFDASKVPMGSRHLTGQACDIYDPNGELMAWCQDNVLLLESIGLWMEEPDDQKRVHFQSVPPKSRNRFFKP